ncbi:MAG: hypothetical protein J6X71_01565 [Bacteroidales bacterium]|nr:hypothetical protein [Bacteroidales bacterium]
MVFKEKSRAAYKAPAADASIILSDLLCDSLVDGGLEDISEEDWIL